MRISLTRSVAVVGAVMTMWTPMAQAAPGAQSDWALSGNVSLVSDYRFRAISQTYRGPAVQGGFDLNHGAGFYAGTWASNVSGNQYPGGNGMEVDLYGGYRFDLDHSLKADVGLIHYLYPDAKLSSGGKRFDTTEIYGGLALGDLSLKLNYSLGDSFGVNDSSGSFYLDMSYQYALTDTLSLSLHVGRADIHNGTQGGATDPNYTDYKVGLVGSAAGLSWGIAYIGNNAKDGAYTVTHASDGSSRVVSKDTVVLSVGKAF